MNNRKVKNGMVCVNTICVDVLHQELKVLNGSKVKTTH